LNHLNQIILNVMARIEEENQKCFHEIYPKLEKKCIEALESNKKSLKNEVIVIMDSIHNYEE